jgi:hypothetical protein
MPYKLQNVYLASYTLNVMDISNLALLKHFNCYFLSSKSIEAKPNLSKSAFADLLIN